MDRRQLLAAAPLLALPSLAFGQPAATPPSLGGPRPAPAPISFPPPTLAMTTVAEGLHIPEAPVVMKDGSVLFVQIEAKQISRLTPAGKVELVAQLEGGPNGLAIGPDKALYIANDGGRFSFIKRGEFNFPGALPADFKGGAIQRLDLKTGKATTLYDTCEGKPLIAPDDLVFDHQGGMWISEYGKARGDGAIYYARSDGKGIKLVKGAMNAPNGIGLSPDGKQLHVSTGRQLLTFDIKGPGELAASTSYPDAVHGALRDRSVADSLKVLADNKVCVCTLIAGGISIFDKAGNTEFIQFDDPMTTNLAFGGADMRDVWVTSSGRGMLRKVRWPYPGLKPAYSA
ncbi:SMP-30/gluconolactonase/LRE family protein [Phenylobacterium sp.]|jgi:gluconolactonase|uniref:SMP-30/gluconolactonase/LRE family protein n=1 Tax=Phenylobacterium sp. TaxID=1871053 RepID=UPI002F3F1D0E